MILDVEHANADLNCMAMALYAEAHTASDKSKEKIAQVILNRFRTGHFGKDICNIVYSMDEKGRWQFNGVEDIVKGNHEYPTLEDMLKSKLIAHRVYFHKIPAPLPPHVLYFHDTSIKNPFKRKPYCKTDNLIFY
jgi:hypothetical protein